jgi:hypothetical protein
MTRDNEFNSSTPHPPPPCDPFQRYQSDWPRQQHDEDPFIRFRRFADQQFKSFFDSFGLSRSNSDDGNERGTAHSRRGLDATWIDLRGHEHEILDIITRAKRAQDAYEKQEQQQRLNAVELPATFVRAGEGVSESRVPDTELDMYQDKDRLREPPNVWDVPTGQLDPFDKASHLKPWLRKSPYSPLYLSHDRQAGSQIRGPKGDAWFEAFQDLANRGHLEELHEHPPPGVFLKRSRQHRKYWHDWEDRLHHQAQRQQNDLGRESKVVQQSYDNPDNSDANRSNEAAHEIADLHQADNTFAGSIAQAIKSVREVFGDDAISQAQAECVTEHVSQASQGSMAATTPATTVPSIVETMIRTVVQTTPEGQIETRRVLKRRFSDGKEETEETIEYSPTHRDVPEWLKTHLAAATCPTVDKQTQTQTQTQTQAAVNDNDNAATESVKTEKLQQRDIPESRGGWFWR